MISEDGYGNVYMQTPTPNEDGGLLQTKLREFNAILDELPTSTNVSKALSDCPDYSDDMKLIFLRCEVFNVELAVKRFIQYWEKRVEVFGEKAFSSLLSLANDDSEATECKYTQVAESALQEESVQKKGIVIYVRCLKSIRDWRVRLCKNVISSVKGTLPVRLAGCHLIDPPLILHGVISMSKKMMGEKLGKRVYIHSGSLDKNLKSLSTFGLGRVEMYPTVFGGQLGVKSSY
ncbi:hypothetical protein THAOC_03919 [Thalassiosira oceanica]|uniref:CRAL-TRIO domain-containing protein n=1 Tax=Thalassiosira oceanica TaxID=159749 RepID=K0TB86_THAOC|nr:hypothetical protein THAOC_03919 [Thalassiosira oceanica]|eukprot:EJK74404.1 hypothetical protein THAOC_03919 [Thalassiosira oceanica]